MQYKITQQFSKGAEAPLAELSSMNDAELFIPAKIIADESKALKLIYRLYNHESLSREYNKEKITTPIDRAQYAEGHSDFPFTFAEPFSVLKKNNQNQETLLAKFCSLDDAKLFVEVKIKANDSTLQNASLLIFNGKQCIEKIDSSIRTQESSEHSGKGQQASFRPTPFAVAPRLGPAKWTVDEDEKKKK